MVGLSEFLQWFVRKRGKSYLNSVLPGIVVALVVLRKQASEFVLIRGYTNI